MKRMAIGAALLVAGALGCNVLTGATEVSTDLDDDDAQTQGTGGQIAVGSGGSGGAMPTQCDYPTGVSYGVSMGETVPQHLQWQGYREGSDTPETLSITDYYDCDGSKGVNALIISTSQFGCGGCYQESSELQGLMDSGWKDMGIKVIVLILDNPQDENNPTADDALTWKNQFGLIDVAVAADPGFSMVPGNSVGTPQMTVIDPRTMQVAALQEGYPGPSDVAVQIAQQNQQ